jgi:hypothetical protein
MSYKKAELSAKKSLEDVARKNGVSVDEVKSEIELAIAIARENSDPKVQAFWNSVPSKGKVPTPEEVIAYIAEMGHGITH